MAIVASVISVFALNGCGSADSGKSMLSVNSGLSSSPSSSNAQDVHYSNSNRWCELRGFSIYFDGTRVYQYNSLSTAQSDFGWMVSWPNNICGAPRGTRCWLRANSSSGFDIVWDNSIVISHSSSFRNAADDFRYLMDRGYCTIANTLKCELRGKQIYLQGQLEASYENFVDAASNFNRLIATPYCTR